MKYKRPSTPIDQTEETPRRKSFEVDPKDLEIGRTAYNPAEPDDLKAYAEHVTAELKAEVEESRQILKILASAGTKYPGSLLSDCMLVQAKAAAFLIRHPDRPKAVGLSSGIDQCKTT